MQHTPLWAKKLLNMQERLMSQSAELKQAVVDLTNALNANFAEMDDLLTKIATPGTPDADVSEAITALRGLIDANTAELDKAKAATV